MKELPTRLTLCSLCIVYICEIYIFIISCFGADDRICVLISPAPYHCLFVAFLPPMEWFIPYFTHRLMINPQLEVQSNAKPHKLSSMLVKHDGFSFTLNIFHQFNTR